MTAITYKKITISLTSLKILNWKSNPIRIMMIMQNPLREILWSSLHYISQRFLSSKNRIKSLPVEFYRKKKRGKIELNFPYMNMCVIFTMIIMKFFSGHEERIFNFYDVL